VSPCPYDEQGNNTCAGKSMEKNHRCTKMCYGDQDIDFDEDHRYSMIHFCNWLNAVEFDWSIK